MIPSVDLRAALDAVTEHWSLRVDDQYVKVAKVLGELVWHEQDDGDELFLVLRGRLRIQFEGGCETVLEEGQFCVVPRGTMHNPVADEGCGIALVETVTTRHTGDVETPRMRSIAGSCAKRDLCRWRRPDTSQVPLPTLARCLQTAGHEARPR